MDSPNPPAVTWYGPNTPAYKVGDWVRVRYSLMFNPYKIVSIRGPFGGGGMLVYGLRYGEKPRLYTEIREDQIEAVVEPPRKTKRKPQTDAPAS